MRRAHETAQFFGTPMIDERLAEIARPFVTDPQDDFAAYFSNRAVVGWKSQADAIARFDACVAEHGDAIYVTHGTVLSLFMASRCRDLDAHAFWTGLRNPDAFFVREDEAVRLG